MNKRIKSQILTLGAISFIFSIGIYFIVMFFLGLDIKAAGFEILVTVCTLISAILWIFLLNRNS